MLPSEEGAELRMVAVDDGSCWLAGRTLCLCSSESDFLRGLLGTSRLMAFAPASWDPPWCEFRDLPPPGTEWALKNFAFPPTESEWAWWEWVARLETRSQCVGEVVGDEDDASPLFCMLSSFAAEPTVAVAASMAEPGGGGDCSCEGEVVWD